MVFSESRLVKTPLKLSVPSSLYQEVLYMYMENRSSTMAEFHLENKRCRCSPCNPHSPPAVLLEQVVPGLCELLGQPSRELWVHECHIIHTCGRGSRCLSWIWLLCIASEDFSGSFPNPPEGSSELLMIKVFLVFEPLGSPGEAPLGKSASAVCPSGWVVALSWTCSLLSLGAFEKSSESLVVMFTCKLFPKTNFN